MVEPIPDSESRTGYAFSIAFSTRRLRPVTIDPTLGALVAAYTWSVETCSSHLQCSVVWVVQPLTFDRLGRRTWTMWGARVEV